MSIFHRSKQNYWTFSGLDVFFPSPFPGPTLVIFKKFSAQASGAERAGDASFFTV